MLMLGWDYVLSESSYYLWKEPENCEDTEVIRKRSREKKGRTARQAFIGRWED